MASIQAMLSAWSHWRGGRSQVRCDLRQQRHGAALLRASESVALAPLYPLRLRRGQFAHHLQDHCERPQQCGG